MTNDDTRGDATANLEIEPASMKSSGRCACCGKSRRTAWGFVYRDGGPRACYFVEWTLGRIDCAARFDVVVGSWFDGTTEDDREAVSLEYRLLDTGPSFAVVDAAGRPAAEVGRATKGSEVAGTPLAEEVVTIAGAVLEIDDRVSELSARAPA
ncbi:MAG: hypothetical protein KF795_12915 [Labilithrix sp.]|nr:hypothetical protein [Labilithrix sp.]